MFKKCKIGISDEFGEPIREGDMLRVLSYGAGVYSDDGDGLGTVVYIDDIAMFKVYFDTFVTDFDSLSGYECEIVGSIYDREDEQE